MSSPFALVSQRETEVREGRGLPKTQIGVAAEMGSWVCLPSGVGGVTVSGALPRRSLSALLLKSPISLLPSYQFHHNRRRVCASASSGAKELQQQQYVRSPDLVALEYADLNLTHKISEVFVFVISSSFSFWVERIVMWCSGFSYFFYKKLKFCSVRKRNLLYL